MFLFYPLFWFLAWENRRHKKGTPIRESKLTLFTGLLWCLFCYGMFLIVVVSYILEEIGEPIKWIPFSIAMFLLSLPGLFYIRLYLKRSIIVKDDHFLEYRGKKVTKITYNDIRDIKVETLFGKSLQEDTVGELILTIYHTDQKYQKVVTRRKKLEGIGLQELYDKIHQYKQGGSTDVRR